MRKRTKKLIFIYSGIAVLFIAILCLFIFIGRKKIYTLNYYVNGELYKTVETDTYEPIEVEGIPLMINIFLVGLKVQYHVIIHQAY